METFNTLTPEEVLAELKTNEGWNEQDQRFRFEDSHYHDDYSAVFCNNFYLGCYPNEILENEDFLSALKKGITMASRLPTPSNGQLAEFQELAPDLHAKFKDFLTPHWKLRELQEAIEEYGWNPKGEAAPEQRAANTYEICVHGLPAHSCSHCSDDQQQPQLDLGSVEADEEAVPTAEETEIARLKEAIKSLEAKVANDSDRPNIAFDPNRHFKTSQVCVLLNLSQQSVTNKAASGELEAVKSFSNHYVKGEWLFDKAAVLDLLANENGAAA